MAVQKFLEELSIQQLAEKYSFIVPEIQREYVWGNNDFKILDKFFYDIKEAIRVHATNDNNEAQINAMEKMLERADDKDKDSIRKMIDTYLSKKDLNIGFLYSYRPYYNYNDTINDVYLIDGQQRLTTLFLTLFYFSLKEKENYEDFISLIRFNSRMEKIGFDYRVRTLTHNFLIDLISHCNKLSDLQHIDEQTWFLFDYSGDVTVKAMLNAVEKLEEHFKDDNTKYYHFVKKQIRFWHFKTEDTSQGEELYITMNSRGQQLADNETMRAKLFENENIKSNQKAWGAKWEEWQDFFWKNKEKGGNADNGLNQFLRWANIIETFANSTFKTRDLAEKKYKSLMTENLVLDDVSLFEIEPYFNSLEKLTKYAEDDLFKDPFFQNNFSIDWIKGDMGQIHLMKLFPALMFLKADKPKEELNRFIRFFYSATNDADIAKSPDNYIIESIVLTKLFLDEQFTDVVQLVTFKDQFPKLLTSEEICKLRLYAKQSDTTVRNKMEVAFWKAEDFKFSKGKIGHLLQLTDYKGKLEEFSYSSRFDYESISELDVDKFQSIFLSYTELINLEYEVWGDLLITSVYVQENDRLYAAGNWYLNSEFLQLVMERKLKHAESLNHFLTSKEKDFINNYSDFDEMVHEESIKRQIYLYYILHKRILNKWNWSKWNFGIYDGDDYPDASSLFANRHVYQFYNAQWRYNVGYEPGTGIWIQDNFESERDYLNLLLEWAKN